MGYNHVFLANSIIPILIHSFVSNDPDGTKFR